MCDIMVLVKNKTEDTVLEQDDETASELAALEGLRVEEWVEKQETVFDRVVVVDCETKMMYCSEWGWVGCGR